MVKRCLWIAGAVLLICGTLIGTTLVIRQNRESEIITEYLRQDNVTYLVAVHDPEYNLTLALAGTRCYEAIPPAPEWSTIRHYYQPTYYPIAYERSERRPSGALDRLRC
jgi:hypothetical protein